VFSGFWGDHLAAAKDWDKSTQVLPHNHDLRQAMSKRRIKNNLTRVGKQAITQFSVRIP